VTNEAKLLPGGPVADHVLGEVVAEAQRLRDKRVVPSLATVLVGDDDASAGYIRIKQKTAAEHGFVSPHVHLSATATQADLHQVIADFNNDPSVHGLLVQYPIPSPLDYDLALSTVDPDKDVDGMHPHNLGRLSLNLLARVLARPQASRRSSPTTRSPCLGERSSSSVAERRWVAPWP
jgi:methylenetetrahydrofolate dehydrogenase (NADP+) / methenyltetrahydrofolate cyclohydrolase